MSQYDFNTPARKLRRLPAAYDSKEGNPLCPVCWSRPDIDWGKGRGKGPSRLPKGWNLSIKKVRGREIATAHYRCSSPICGTMIKVSYVYLDFGNYVYESEQILTGDAYREGYHDRNGVWHGTKPEPKEQVEPVLVESGPWAYIEYPPLEGEFPKHWTRDGNRIKVSRKSEQYKKIRKWFHRKGIDLGSPR